MLSPKLGLLTLENAYKKKAWKCGLNLFHIMQKQKSILKWKEYA
jgi:hypothetical protein